MNYPGNPGGVRMSKIQELLERREGIFKKARELVDRAEAESRDMDAPENEAFEKAMADAQALKDQAARLTRLEQVEAELTASRGVVSRPEAAKLPVEDRKENADVDSRKAEEAEYRALRRYIVGGLGAMSNEDKIAIRWAGEAEKRTQQMDVDTAGGYLVLPQRVQMELIKAVDDRVHIRQLSRTFPLTDAASLGVPSLETDYSDYEWTTELATGSKDDLVLGKRELRPHPAAKRVKISRKLLRSAAMDPIGIVQDRLADKLARTQEKGFLTGTGFQQPLGVFTASNDGIPTGRDVSTGNTTTTVTFDGLKSAQYTLKDQYWPGATWLFHRTVMAQIAKEKDGEGRYLLQPAVNASEGDRILGFPVRVSEFAPSTMTSGLYVGILGNFQAGYWIVDALTFELQRLDELYAEDNTVGFITRFETDAAPVLGEAFVRVKLA